MQLVKSLTLVPMMALAAPHSQEVNRRNIPDSPDLSIMDGSQLNDRNSPLQKSNKHMTGSIPDKQSKMSYAFHLL